MTRGSSSPDDGRSEEEADPHHERLVAEAESEEFLRDAVPEPDAPHSYGLRGRPLPTRSPFFTGFLGAAGALLAFWIGQRILSISGVLILILVACFLAVGLNPSVEFFIRRGVRRPWAVLLVTVGVLAAIGLFLVALVPVISDQVTALVDQVPQWFHQIQHNNTIRGWDRKYHLIDRLQNTIENARLGNKVFGGVLGIGLAVLSAVTNTFVVVVLTLYFLASLPSMKRFVYRLAPASRRERVTHLGDAILENVGSYVSGAFVVAMCAGISSLIFLLVVGLAQYAVALAAVVTLLDVIPMIGATLGALIVTAIGFAEDPRIGLFCLIFYIVYQQFENYVIYPRVMSRSVDIPGSVIVIAALIGASLLGVIGALLAIPTAAAVQLLLREVFLPRQEEQ